MFVIFCYVTRCTAAVGTAAAVTATYTIAAQTFPDHVAQTVVSNIYDLILEEVPRRPICVYF